MELELEIGKNSASEVKSILAMAKLKAQTEAESLISEAKKDNAQKLASVKEQANSEIKMKKKSFVFDRKQATLLGKQKVIDFIFSDVTNKILELEGANLFSFVTYQINKNFKEIVCKTEEECKLLHIVMKTNKEDYKKYATVLATKAIDSELLELDILNKNIGFSIKLSNEPLDIKGGFVLETEDFDLNFSLEEIINTLLNKHEKEIAKEIFG